jgi:dienelactone hydrolase
VSPSLKVFGPTSRADARAAVLVLHGGQEESKARVHRFRPAYLRMLPFARDLAWAGRETRLSAMALLNRYRGWNRPDLDAVADARWALDDVRRTNPGVPVVLVGHSMGGRVALRVADDPSVTAVCALAPWITEKDRVEQLAGRTVLIAHGDQDRTTDPKLSYAYAVRAKEVTEDVCRFEVRGEAHAMLRRAKDWRLLVRRFVLGTLGATEMDHVIAAALAKPAPGGLAVTL